MKNTKKNTFLLLIAILSLAFNIEQIKAETIIVPDDHETINKAIQDANDGDTIYVRAGTYEGTYEEPTVNVNKSVSIIGEDRDTTIIDGNNVGSVVTISVPDVNISRFTIQHSGSDFPGEGLPDAGICIAPVSNNINNVNISYCIVRNNSVGIYLGTTGLDVSHNRIFVNNITDNNYYGVMLVNSSNNKFYHNNFIDNDTQVNSVNSDNFWDNDYPSGGNYWSDYIGDDNHVDGGPNENEPFKDGIEDDPHPIPNENDDQFPSLKPYELSVHNKDTGLDYYTIQEAINEAGRGETIVVSSRSYPYYEKVNVNKTVWLAEDTNAPAPTIDGIRNYGDVVTITANNTHVEGFTIKNAAYGFYGINLNGHRFNHIIGNTIDNISTNRLGIEVYSSNYTNLIDNQITAEGTCIDIINSDNVLVSNNTITSSDGLGIVISDSNNAKIIGNNVISKEESIYIGGNSHNNEVRGNDVCSYADTGAAILVSGVLDANTTIAYNIVTSNYYGIKLTNTSNNTISGNEVSQCGYKGLGLFNAPNTIIENNVVKSNEYGIDIYISSDCNVVQNIISHNNYGINLAAGPLTEKSNCNIIGNKIVNNGCGLKMYLVSDCNIIDNVLSSNMDGFLLSDSNSNLITRNQIMNNPRWGILVTDSNDNKIYHNIFVNNFNNAGVYFPHGTSLKNYWDNGYQCDANYPSGGNFWSDLEDVHDECHGPNQTECDCGDYEAGCTNYGIVDDWHYIEPAWVGIEDSNNVDRYPILLASYKITKPDRAVMKEPYKLKVELINNTRDILDPCGLYIDVNGIEQVPPPHPASVFTNKWDLDYNTEIYELPAPREIPLDETPVLLARTFRNNWNWIKPQDWKSVVMGIILSKVSTKYSIASFIGSCFDARKAVPHLTYTFEPYRSPMVLFSTDVKVHTPQEKHVYLHGSIVTQGASIICSICAAVCSFWNPPAATAFTRAAVLYTIESIGFYYLAEDPDKNYTEICLSRTVSLPEYEGPEEGRLLDGSVEKRLARTALELACLEEAYKESYIRYDGAKEDGSSQYMELQLNAAIRYNAMATRKLEELQFLNGVVIAGMPEPNDNDVNNFRAEILANGLPEIQREILEMFDCNDSTDPNDPNAADVCDLILAVTNPNDPNAEAMRDACKDPNNLLRYTQLLIQDHYIADYALRAAAGAQNLTVLEPEQALSPLAYREEGQTTEVNLTWLPAWSPGCGTILHDVYFGTSYDAVSDANVDNHMGVYKGRQEGTSYNFSGLELGTTYYWRIDEVCSTNVLSKGPIHEFKVNHIILDDFESYAGTGELTAVWEDWHTLPEQGGEDHISTDIVHDGTQAMGFYYDTYYGDPVLRRTYDSPQDWTAGGLAALSLWFYGDANDGAGNTADGMYVTLEDSDGDSTAIAYDGDANDLTAKDWQEWNIALQDFNDANNVNPDKIKSITLGITGGTTGQIYFDDIRLYIPRCVSEKIKPAGDITGDCVVDYEDLRVLAEDWLWLFDDKADVYKDDNLDFKDYAVLMESWLEELKWPPLE